MESQPQNPELRNNPENFHPWHCIPLKCATKFEICNLLIRYIVLHGIQENTLESKC